MINLNWEGMDGEIGAMMARFNTLPRHIAKKHLLAAIKRAGKDGVKVLKSNTPKARTRNVRGSGGTASKQRGGALRRAATVKAKYRGRNRDGSAYGTLGYKYGTESRKAIFLEFGTPNVEPRRMIERTMQQWGTSLVPKLEAEMAAAFEKAVKELEAGMNPGMSKRGTEAGVSGRG
jgi:HK97 gp10 family phage protein